MKLTHKLKGELLKIESVTVKDPYVLHKLNNIGIAPGTVIEVLDYSKSKDILHLKVFNVEYALRAEDCRDIDVSRYS